ncbi:M48 family metallopeptidase [Pseudoroseicyclus aestuarii]|uniref:YgjP-like metallopeptidase domain-containing protein n=1 Tax=Pseudoroseicyclus aestuarii TaxID=1795041 RepID=A0A318SUB4_9RHOB|nr:SprT family zinc-dependent metalloprotease [Pseudoroseicyclus aestuarii]PYE84955.1 hypothetical protein DFP88_102759 [Pseudoroseicyclus aestuarii]
MRKPATEMEEHVLPGPPPIHVTLRRSARASRISLRVARRDGRVTLTLPPRARRAQALAFLAEREAWLRGHLEAVPPVQAVRLGGTLPYRGGTLTLAPAPVRRAALEGDHLLLPEEPARAGARAMAFLKTQARDMLVPMVAHHAGALGLPHGRVTLRDTRSRWGSCTARGDIMLSWRLVMAPEAVADYVAAHEVAHLARMDHSPEFWAVVARLVPDYDRHRRWLRQHGEALHRVDFSA